MGFGNRQPLQRVGDLQPAPPSVQPGGSGRTPMPPAPGGPTNVFGGQVGAAMNPTRDAAQGPQNLAAMWAPTFATNPFKRNGANFNKPPSTGTTGTVGTPVTRSANNGQQSTYTQQDNSIAQNYGSGNY